MVDVATTQPSPFARSLLFGYVAQFVYEGDSPLAERRAAALSLDQGLLAELLGRAELRELLDPEVLAEVEAELQRLAPDRRARDAEGVADLLRLLGPLTTAEVAERCAADARRRRGWLAALADARRVVEVRIAGEERWAAVEDVGRLRDGLGVPVPPGTPDAFTEPVADPLADLVARLRPHPRPVHHRRGRRAGSGSAAPSSGTPCSGWPPRAGCSTASSGPPAPAASGATPRCCAGCGAARWPRLRKEVEPVEPRALGRFLPAWQHVAAPAAACAASTACSRWSSSWPAARSRPRRSSRWCCRPGSATTSRR